MKLNEYFSLSDVATLSIEQFEALRKYLKFIGIDFDLSYEYISFFIQKDPDTALTAWDSNGSVSTPYIVITYPDDEDLTTLHEY